MFNNNRSSGSLSIKAQYTPKGWRANVVKSVSNRTDWGMYHLSPEQLVTEDREIEVKRGEIFYATRDEAITEGKKLLNQHYGVFSNRQ